MMNSNVHDVGADTGGWFHVLDPSIPFSNDDCNSPHSTVERPLLRYSKKAGKTVIITSTNGKTHTYTNHFCSSMDVSIFTDFVVALCGGRRELHSVTPIIVCGRMTKVIISSFSVSLFIWVPGKLVFQLILGRS